MNTVWYKTKSGIQLLQMQREKLAKILPTLHGYYLLHVAPGELISCIDSSLILHRVNTHTDLIANDDALPILSDSVDVVVLTHTLEQRNYDPHQILREANRVLIPGGHLVITGLHLWNFWGMKLFLLDTQLKWVAVSKLKDWLSLLDFQLIEPVAGSFSFGSFKNFFTNSCIVNPIYTLVAVKRVAPLTLIKPAWSKPIFDWGTNEEIS